MNAASPIPTAPGGHGLLAGKGVLVTAAAGSGIGSSTARRCLEEGARVVIVGRDAAKVAAAERELGAAAVGVVGDACETGTAAAAVATAISRFGGFQIGRAHV